MRLALIGAGRWGKKYISTLASMDGVCLARLGSRNPESARIVPANCKISSDWHEVATATDIDGVIIATPPALHARMAIAALQSGHAALIEKPLTLNLEEAVAIQDASEKFGRPVMVDHTHLYSEAFRKLKLFVPKLGGALHIEGSAGNFGPFRSDILPLWDWGVHDVSMCLDIAGKSPEHIVVRRNNFETRDGGLAEDVEFWLNFSTGLTAHIHVSNLRSDKSRYLTVQCSHGIAIYNDLVEQKLSILTEAEGQMRPRLEAYMPLTTAIREFCALIASGIRSSPSLSLGVDCVQTLYRAQCALPV
jgi:predicted dehydrogenase